MTKPPEARYLAVRHLCVRQLVFWLLVVSSFNYLKMHAWSTCMLLLLHSAFMLSMVKLLLKGEVGVCVLNSHGNYIVDHGKSWNCDLNFCGNPVIPNRQSMSTSKDPMWTLGIGLSTNLSLFHRQSHSKAFHGHIYT